jgi:hypothetical protein
MQHQYVFLTLVWLGLLIFPRPPVLLRNDKLPLPLMTTLVPKNPMDFLKNATTSSTPPPVNVFETTIVANVSDAISTDFVAPLIITEAVNQTNSTTTETKQELQDNGEDEKQPEEKNTTTTGAVQIIIKNQTTTTGRFVFVNLTSTTNKSTMTTCNPEFLPYLPCLNGGTCHEKHFICLCKKPFTGPKCATRIYACLPNPCQNGGKCEDVCIRI